MHSRGHQPRVTEGWRCTEKHEQAWPAVEEGMLRQRGYGKASRQSDAKQVPEQSCGQSCRVHEGVEQRKSKAAIALHSIIIYHSH